MQTRSRAGGPILTTAVALVGLALLVTARIPTAPGAPAPSMSTAQGTPTGTPDTTPTATPTATPAAAALLAVGDIASCDSSADEVVGELAARMDGTIALLGDIAYPDGSTADYEDCFDSAWGQMVARIRPTPGNHDYQTTDAAGYFGYFAPAAGTPGEGWYSYDLSAWHVIALNSECDAIGGCGTGSPQLSWLVADLAAHPAACTVAYWHHPRFSSGRHGDHDMTDALWRALAAAGADLVLGAHDHDYERFAPIDGMRSFVVGTGGRSLYEWPGSPGPSTELRGNDTYGLLELTLRPADYSWRFVPATGGSLTDAGTGTCH